MRLRCASLLLVFLLQGCGLGVGGAVERNPSGSLAYPTITLHITDFWDLGYGSFFARNLSREPLLVGMDFYLANRQALKSKLPSLHPGVGLGVMAEHTEDTTYLRGLGGFVGVELLFLKHYNPKVQGMGRFRSLYFRGYLFGHTFGPAFGFGAEIGFRMSTEPSI